MLSRYTHTLWAYLRSRYLNATLSSRRAIERYQARRLDQLVSQRLPEFAFYKRHLEGGFERLPIMDKAALMTNFERCNRAGFSADYIRQALLEGRQQEGTYFFGQSTGTSGNRGYYVVSEKERYIWLGTILAKTLPDALWRRHRVAIALPGMSSLYSSANSGSRVQLAFFDTADGIHRWEDELVRFAPDTIVASPKALRYLAERGKLGATNIFSGAEVLDPLDRETIEGITGVMVRQIYMATEGLFGVSCQRGSLHLAEDVVHFEWEEAAPGNMLKKPIVTDFTRKAQAMTRYRMNDLLELSDEPCPCGSAFQRVKAVHGRADDIFTLENAAGEVITVTPDVIRNAIIDSHPEIDDFRAAQTGPASIEITLKDATESIAEPAKASLRQRLEHLGVPAQIDVVSGINVPFDSKLRRVRNDWSGR